MTAETTAFANAVIFDGVSAGLREGCVRVAAGTIIEVGERPEAGDRVVDCRGRTVVPGLIDAHFHVYGARLSLMEIETSPLSYLGGLGVGVITVAAEQAVPFRAVQPDRDRPAADVVGQHHQERGNPGAVYQGPFGTKGFS